MNKYKSCSALKSEAREALTGKYGSFILMLLVLYSVILAIETAISIFISVPEALTQIFGGGTGSSNAIGTVRLLLQACLTIFVGMFKAGTVLFCLNARCGRKSGVSDLFYPFHDFRRSLAVSAAVLIPQIILLLPCNILQLIYQNTGELNFLIAAFVCFAAGACLYIPISIMLSMSFYLLLDFPQYSAREILAMSIKITKGHRGKLFYMELSFIPVRLLVLLSCGIGILWAFPYISMTYTEFYLDRMKA
ncbi:MAG: DUF975 family protein [Lachnospiraceae bacterium]|nr:DUF975 family protein [Lachnospiraceae bacterium]